MISNNIKWIAGSILLLLWSGFISKMSMSYQSNKDDVKSFKDANILLIQDKYHKDKIIDHLTKQIESNEIANNKLELERDTISLEYDYANSVIKTYQKKLDSFTHIDPSFVRYIKYTQESKRLSESAADAFIFETAVESATASGILSYINAKGKSLDECYAQNQAIKDWYDDLYKRYNEFNK